MKKILNEWRRFLRESETEDDKTVARAIMGAIDPSSINTPESTEFLRRNKMRAARLIRNLLDGDESVFSVSPNETVVKVGSAQYQFDRHDFYSRLTGALEILEDSRTKFDFSMFNARPEQLRTTPYPGKYGPKDHAGGATDTGIVIPDEATDDEIAQIVADINKYKSYYMYKSEDHIISSQDYEESLNHLVAAYEGLYHLWMEYSPLDSEFDKVKTALESAINAREIGIEMTDEEKADRHMKTGNEFMANQMKEAALEFRNAKALYKKLGMSSKAREAQKLFQKARSMK